MKEYPEDNKQPILITEFDEVDWNTFKSVKGDDEELRNEDKTDE